MSTSVHFILYDSRACGDSGNGEASILVSCDDDKEARSYAGDYGDMACYRYDEKNQSDLWQWDWTECDGFT